MSENALASSLVKCWNVVEIVMWWHILTDIMSIFFFCLFCLKKNPNAWALAVHIGAKVVLKLSLNFYHPTFSQDFFQILSSEEVSGQIAEVIGNYNATSYEFKIHCVMHLMISFTLFLHTTAYDHDFDSAGGVLPGLGSCWFETKVQYWMPACCGLLCRNGVGSRRINIIVNRQSR